MTYFGHTLTPTYTVCSIQCCALPLYCPVHYLCIALSLPDPGHTHRGASVPCQGGTSRRQKDTCRPPGIVVRRMSVSTLTSDDEDSSSDSRHNDRVLAETMCSEYQLREREGGVCQRQYYSVQNMRQQLVAMLSTSDTAQKAVDASTPCATCYRVRSPTADTVARWRR